MQPLAGVRVLDLSRLVAGNVLTWVLADFGAEVIKVEQPGRGDLLREWRAGGHELHWKVYSRNKKSITLNLRHPKGVELLLQLAEKAHVLVESFMPGKLEEMGLAPEVLWRRNPRLIVTRVSGWGQTGPYVNLPGTGSIAEGMSGFAMLNAPGQEEPVLPPLSLADSVAGLFGASATLMALRHCEVQGGAGQVIDVSLWEALFSLMGPEAATYRLTGRNPAKRTGGLATLATPPSVYRSKDGKWFSVSAPTQVLVERLLKAYDLESLLADERFRTNEARLAHFLEFQRLLQEKTSQFTLEENLRRCNEAGAPAGPIYNISDILADPHAQAREMVVDVPDPDLGSIPMQNITPRLSLTPGRIGAPAPKLGEHNVQVFTSLGYTKADVEGWAREGIV